MRWKRATVLLVVYALFFCISGAVSGVLATGGMQNTINGPAHDSLKYRWDPVQADEHANAAGRVFTGLKPGLMYRPVTGWGDRLSSWNLSAFIGTFNISGDHENTIVFRTAGTGYLEGTATIGPLCAVEPCQVTDEQLAAAYEARHLVVTADGPDGKEYMVKFTSAGYYHVELPVGRYQVTIAENGTWHGYGGPWTVVIKRGMTVTLNIPIDTGIR